MNKKSIWAVVAGVLVIVVTTLVDIVLHATGIQSQLAKPLGVAGQSAGGRRLRAARHRLPLRPGPRLAAGKVLRLKSAPIRVDVIEYFGGR